MSSPFVLAPDPEHESAELYFDGYVLTVQPGDDHAGQSGHHLAVYPPAELRDSDLDAHLPPALWEVLLPPALQVLSVPPGGRHGT